MNKLANKYGTNFDLCTNRIVNKWNNNINLMEMGDVNVLKEIIDIRDGRMVCVTLSIDDILSMCSI